MALVGAPNDGGTALQLIGVAGVNANDVVLELDDVSRFNEFTFMSTTGIMDVEVSLDGTNYVPATFTNQSTVVEVEVLVTVANQVFKLTLDKIKAIRISQFDATAVANPLLICGKVGR